VDTSAVDRLWPDFDRARILFEDADLIAVDKPEGVSSQAADPDHPDDLVFRLKRALGRDYLGVHQRLDKDTSGAILYAKEKRANAGLAAQFEQRKVEKLYLAIAEGWRGGDRTLAHQLVVDDKRTRVASKNDRRAKRAVSHVRVMERAGTRVLLEVRIDTGRTHQIRAQLAAEGAPVLGDRLYGGAPAARLMLHASAIALSHPITGERLEIAAPRPPIFALAMRAIESEIAMRSETFSTRDAIAMAIERRWGLARRRDLDAFRLLNEAEAGTEGWALDRYGHFLVLHLYSDRARANEAAILDALDALGMRGTYVKRRPKRANEVDATDEALAPHMPMRGAPAPEGFSIREHGIEYRAHLGEGLSTGIFLDQRDNRLRVRELAKDARVLNLFAYTCAFTRAAAIGGARETLSVDASGRALERGRENLAGAPGENRFLCADVFDALAALAKKNERFDLVCVDPPTHSTTRSGRWTSDWERLFAAVFGVLAPGGRALACSNDRRLSIAKFRRAAHEGAREAKIEIAQMKDLACPADFPPPFGEEPHLKSLLVHRSR
jgi:23S rRNA (cytosine1962-C5)-methyltransferase